MSKNKTNLVIVESAAKSKTIQKYLNEMPELRGEGRFVVMACLGHVEDLPAKELGVCTRTWEPRYVPIPGKEKVLTRLRAAVKEADRVFLASDEDNEGEAIAAHLRRVLRLGGGTRGIANKPVARIGFIEITKPALLRAIRNPRDIDPNRVAAQEARRILDRVVGYEASPLLWRRFPGAKGLSAGRVQSCALYLLVARLREAREHQPAPFWGLEGRFVAEGKTVGGAAAAGPALVVRCYRPVAAAEGGPKKKKAAAQELATWEDAEEARALLGRLAGAEGWQARFSAREAKRGPSAPFTTSTLQQEAYNRHGMTAKTTMRLAQGLYEAGHITYMRTDSVALSEEAQAAILAHITTAHGAAWACPRTFRARAANAQGAHEAIRPTRPDATPAVLRELAGAEGGAGGNDGDGDGEGAALTPAHLRLYDLIWRRAVASQMIAATYQEVTYVVTGAALPAGHEMRGGDSVLTHPGYLAVYAPDQRPDPEALRAWEGWLATGEVAVAHAVAPAELTMAAEVTRPPGLYNEPGLVRALEGYGVGRPSTYASIIEKVLSRGYAACGPNPYQASLATRSWVFSRGATAIEEVPVTLHVGGKETDRMVPTGLGERVTDYLTETMPYLLDTGFTARMEGDLDRITAGERTKADTLNAFYATFHQSVEEALAALAAGGGESAEGGTPKKGAKGTKGTGKKGAKEGAGPKEVLREFAEQGAAVVRTRYGPALFVRAEERFVPVTPYLDWRKKTLADLTGAEVAFLCRLPLRVEGCARVVTLGPYGFYVRDEATKENLFLPRDQWEAACAGQLGAAELMALTKRPGKK